MYEVIVETTFAAAHSLRGYPGDCEKLHGHTWKVGVMMAARRLNRLGVGIDFREVKDLLRGVVGDLDHRNLTDLPQFRKGNPSAEMIARWIYREFARRLRQPGARLVQVQVWESEGTSAIYRDSKASSAARREGSAK
jgi:6-pyruvoyltetrahydropterin/6-carboxytetrahydropterin synthase